MADCYKRIAAPRNSSRFRVNLAGIRGGILICLPVYGVQFPPESYTTTLRRLSITSLACKNGGAVRAHSCRSQLIGCRSSALRKRQNRNQSPRVRPCSAREDALMLTNQSATGILVVRVPRINLDETRRHGTVNKPAMSHPPHERCTVCPTCTPRFWDSRSLEILSRNVYRCSRRVPSFSRTCHAQPNGTIDAEPNATEDVVRLKDSRLKPALVKHK